MPDAINFKGAVLAGGLSTRMGRDKATMLFNGRPLVQWAVEKLRPLCGEVVICGAQADLSSYGVVLQDFETGPDKIGPLAGIAAALERFSSGSEDSGDRDPGDADSSGEILVQFLPVDTPLMPEEFLKWMKTRARSQGSPTRLLSMPTLGGRPEPLFSLCSPRLLGDLQQLLAAGERRVAPTLIEAAHAAGGPEAADIFAVEDVLSEFAADAAPAEWFRNLNRPEDLISAQICAPPVSSTLSPTATVRSFPFETEPSYKV